jgi:hypothetical protein
VAEVVYNNNTQQLLLHNLSTLPPEVAEEEATRVVVGVSERLSDRRWMI